MYLIPELTEEQMQEWRDALVNITAEAWATSETARAEWQAGTISFDECIARHNAATQESWTITRDLLRTLLVDKIERCCGDDERAPVIADALVPLWGWLLYEARQGHEWADRLASTLVPGEDSPERHGLDWWINAYSAHQYAARSDREDARIKEFLQRWRDSQVKIESDKLG